MVGIVDANDEIRSLGGDYFQARIDKAADLGKFLRFGGIVAVGRYADHAIAEAQRK